MFDPEVYSQRRKSLKEKLNNGILLFPGNDESPMNYPSNTFHYRQDSNFLYFFGLDSPGLNAIIDLDNDLDIDKIMEETGHKAEDYNVNIYGICRKCLKI